MPGLSPSMKIKKGRALVGWNPGASPVVTITGSTPSPSIGSNPDLGFTATAIDAELGDMSSSLKWTIVSALAVPATAGVADAAVSGAPAGAAVPAIPTLSYDLDVTVDAGLQQLVVPVAIAEDYDAIAATISGLLTGATCAFVAGAFQITSASVGAASTIVIVEGTGGPSGGGGFIAAVDAAAGGATTFPAPVDGVDLIPEVTVQGGTGPNPPLSFLVIGSQDVVASVTEGAVTVTDSVTINVQA